MPFKDLREYIAKLDEIGEVQTIEQEVDWNLEVGAIIRRSYDLRAPAPFFQKIKGYAEDFRIFGAPIGTSRRDRYYARIATALDMPIDITAQAFIEKYIRRKKNPIAPRIVKDGPCKEVIQTGNDVNLLQFPSPLIHGGDGGRYIGTWHTSITRDPETGWVNWGMYRLMIHDEKTMGGIISPDQHIGLHYYQHYEKRNKPMEFAIAIGTEPVTALMSAIRTNPGIAEAAIVGSLRGEPIDVIQCETVDLQVPATSEIVIEGVVMPEERRAEGPFGEFTGYQAGDRKPRPVFHVKAITHRQNPILPVTCMGVPVDDCAVVIPLAKAANLLDDLRGRGLPVKAAYCPPAGVSFMVIVSTKVPYVNYTQQLAHAIWANNRSFYQVMIVEDDIDVTDWEQVMWAFTTRCHPERGIRQVPNAPGNPLLPFVNAYEREKLLSAYVLFDCTFPKEWPKEFVPIKASFDVMWPQEIQKRVLANWNSYGYKE